MMPHRYTRDYGHSFPRYMWDKYHSVIGYVILTIAIMATIYFTRENLEDQAARIARVEVKAGCERDNATRRAVTQNRQTIYNLLVELNATDEVLKDPEVVELLEPVPLINCDKVGTRQSRQNLPDPISTVIP